MERVLPHASSSTSADILALLEVRIRFAWSRRAAAARFSEAYWEADDDLAWLRMLRDEVARTGRVRAEVTEIVEAPAVAVAIEDGDRSALRTPVASVRPAPPPAEELVGVA